MKLKDEFVMQTVDDENIMVAVDSKIFSGLVRSNKTAAAIIEQLRAEVTRDEIVEKMLSKYDAPRSIIESDVDMVIDNLRKIGALDE